MGDIARKRINTGRMFKDIKEGKNTFRNKQKSNNKV